MLGLVYWVVFGAVAGGVAKTLLPNKLPAGWLPAIAVGIAGSLVGGLPFGRGPAGIIGSIVGACVVLVLYGVWRDDS